MQTGHTTPRASARLGITAATRQSSIIFSLPADIKNLNTYFYGLCFARFFANLLPSHLKVIFL
jgi:hypothetical protein